MRFNVNIVPLMSSESKARILRYVLKEGFRMTGRELARICGISHSMAIDTLKEFESMNLVYNFRAGKSAVWMAKRDSYAFSVAARIFGKTEDYMPIEHMKMTLINGLPAKITKSAVLFGSVARGDERTSSDIDLFVLVENVADKKVMEKKLEDLSAVCGKLYGNTLGFYCLTENEYKARKKLELINNIKKGIKLI